MPEEKKPPYELVREGTEKVLIVNTIGSLYFPSIEDSEYWMGRIIDFLLESGDVQTIILSAERNYVYPFEQARMLNEIRALFVYFTQEKNVLAYTSLGHTPGECSKCYPERLSALRFIIMDLLKKDPVGAYVELVREIRKQKIFLKKTSHDVCKKCYKFYIRLLEEVKDRFEETRLIALVQDKLAGHKPGDRSLYREVFEPQIKPNFMFTRLMAEPPTNAIEIDSYSVGGKSTEVAVFKIPGKIRYLYHVLPPEFRLRDEEYELLTDARNILAKHKPRTAEFVDPQRMRQVFFNISKDLISELAKGKDFKLSYSNLMRLSEILVRLTVGFGLIEGILEDEKVEDVYINAPVGASPIIVKHALFGECVTNVIPNIREADAWATRFRMISGRPLDEANPVLDTELMTDKFRSRVSIVQTPLSPKGLSFAFRRHRDRPWTFPLFLKYKYMSPISAGLLSFLIDGSRTLLVAGTRGSGKTSLLGSILVEIMRRYRVITVEDSVTGGMSLLCEINGKINTLSVEELFNYLSKKYKFKKRDGREILGKNPENIRVYSISKRGRVRLSKVKKFIRHKVNKAIYNITTATGREISVTQDHSLFTISEDKPFEEVKASDLKESDFIATPKCLPLPDKKVRYRNVLSFLNENDKIFIYCKDLRKFSKNIKEQGKKEGYSKPTINRWVRCGFLPIRVYKGLTKKPVATMFKYRHNSAPLPVKIKLDNDFLAFLGLWIADGCYDKKSVILSVVSREERNLVRRIAERYDFKTSFHHDKVSLQINSSTLKYMLKEVCCLKGNAYTKRIPDWVFNLSRRQRASFLKGLFSGDGCVSDKEIIISLASKKLLRDLQSMLLSYGIIFRVNALRERKFHDNDRTKDGRISALKFLRIFKEEIGFIQKKKQKKLSKLCRKNSTHDSTDIIPLPMRIKEKIHKTIKPKRVFSYNDYIKRKNHVSREKLKRILNYVKRDKKLHSYLRALANSDIYWDRIVRITRSNKKQYVYDFSVPGNENFVCSNILAHNTLELPVDYLKKLDYDVLSMKVRSAIIGEKAEMSAEDGIRTTLRLGDSCLIVGEVRSSIKGDQEVFIVENGLTKRVPIKELEKKPAEGVKVPTLDENLKISLHDLKGFVKHPCRKKLLEVTTKTGRKIIVTPDHSLFTQYGFKVGPIETSFLEPGDRVVIPASMPCNYNNLGYLDLTQVLPELRLEHYEPYLRKAINKIGYKKATEICKPPANNDIYIYLRKCSQKIRIPIKKFKKLMEHAKIDYSLDGLNIKSGTSNSLPAKLKVSEDFCRFLGYYLSEGYVSKDGGVIITNSNEPIIDDVIKISENLFNTKPYVRKVRGLGESTQVRISNSVLSRLILKLGCGRVCNEKRIPPIIYGLSEEKICAFLKGLYSGDGTFVSSKRSANMVGYFTTSEKLADDLLYLLLTQKIVAGCRRRKPGGKGKRDLFAIVFKQRDYVKTFLKKIGFVHRPTRHRLGALGRQSYANPEMIVNKWSHSQVNRVDMPKGMISRHVKKLPRKYRHLRRFERCSKYYLKKVVDDFDCSNSLKTFAKGDFYLDEIKEIKEISLDEPVPVYDLSVNPTQNFIGGFGGIILHNTEAKALYEAMRVGALANVVAGTIHGDSPYGVFDRVVNDLGVPPTSFKATDIILICNKLRSPDGLHEYRRVTNVTEVRKHWKEDPLIEKGFFDLMSYNSGTDSLELAKGVLEGESEVLKSIASRSKEWVGRWDDVWENIQLRAKIKQALLDYSKKVENDAVIEADFVVCANDMFHLLCEQVSADVGIPEPERVFPAWERWLKVELKRKKLWK